VPKRFLNTSEIAKYLDINEKKVYSLVRNAGLPATRVTGKWLFPKEMVDEWLFSGVAGRASEPPVRSDCLLIAGSNDPLLESEFSRFSAREGGPMVYFARVGSYLGLEALKKGTAQAATAHILDPKTGEYNLPYLDRKTRERTYFYPLVSREQGIMVRKGNPFGISALRDLTIPGMRFINRRRGSGTRMLFDSLLDETGILSSQIVGYTREVATHIEVALAVYRGSADAGLGIRSAARMFGLDFVPLKKERFDIVVSKEANDSSPFQSLLEDLKSTAFRKSLSETGGYEELDMNPITG
jgi:putative molybdopterin biosynthesis protein